MSDDRGDDPGPPRPAVLASVGEWQTTESLDSATVGEHGEDREGDRGDRRLRGRRTLVLVVVALVVAAAAGGLLLATQIKSPAQQAAETRPPPLTELTATVQRTVITATVLGQASVAAPPEFHP